VRSVTERIVVIGGDAAGMSAASQALRTAKAAGRTLQVTVLERGSWTSYSACGIPYWVAGDVDSPDELIARTPAEHRANGIDLRMGTEATEIDVGARVVHTRENATGVTERLPFDQLVIATGAVPIRPDLPGSGADGTYGLQTLDDGAALLDTLLSTREPRRAVVVGAGYIGVEVAEACHRRGLETTVVDMAPEPMTTLDPDMGALVRTAMEATGIALRTGTSVEGFEVGSDNWVTGVVTDAGTIPADVVVLGIGVRPNNRLAVEAGLPVGASGGLRVDRRQAVAGHDGIWAAGDCVESFHRVSERPVHIALGTHANKQGRVLGTNLAGGYDTFPGVVGTAITKVCDLEIARTGLGEREAAEAGFDGVVGTVQSTTTSGYMPGASLMTVKVIAERSTGRLLGAQIVGEGPGSAKRIDACALAVWNEMSAHALTMADLAYAPPFSPVWDPVQIAARRAGDAATRG
jgi:NADPH-dependent 2,4-dienoyl-CoA reductase/sulfur reductase-like enzyme